jgi:dolichyl-phosphate beta-glucosyltransferase
MTATTIVPCFNEAHRLELPAWQAFAGAHRVLFVDDGSTDATGDLLRGAGLPVLTLLKNRGKGEAVRAGLRTAIDDGADVVGYLDADLSTPTSEYTRLQQHLHDHRDVDVVLGSRIAHLGAMIERRPLRHYLGRVFATSASLALDLPVYDTQCGAKVFRTTPMLTAALSSSFRSRWAFDVELLARLLDAGTPPSRCCELPLTTWRDVAGSHLQAGAMIGAAFDVAAIGWRRRRQRP